MHYEISSIAEYADDIKEIERCLKSLLDEKCYKDKIIDYGKRISIQINFNKAKGYNNEKYQYLLAYIVGIILRNKFVLRHIDKKISKVSVEMNDEEIRKIRIRAAHMYSMKYNDFDYITDKIHVYLTNTKKIYLDGYSDFRMHEIYNEIDSLIEQITKDVKLEKEYDDFINFLAYITDDISVNDGIIHFIVKKRNEYLLLNESLVPIDEYTYSISDKNDIIKILQKLSPYYIIIHDRNKQLDPDIYNEICSSFKRVIYSSEE